MEVIEIKSGWDGALLYSGEHTDVKEAAEAAVKVGANLSGAYLADADLSDADLDGANLADANLSGADLSGAYLVGVNLSDADLTCANLSGAYLVRANLSGANLDGANLTCASLARASLTCANLARANLAGARLADAKIGVGDDGARLVGLRPIVQIGPIGSRNDWLLVFWCGDSGMRISTGCQNQITEHRFLERLTEAHGAGEDADIHVDNYLAALAFAKRLTESHTF